LREIGASGVAFRRDGAKQFVELRLQRRAVDLRVLQHEHHQEGD
jgi:hypothetical protein